MPSKWMRVSWLILLPLMCPGFAWAQAAAVPVEGDRIRVESPVHEGEATFLRIDREDLVILEAGPYGREEVRIPLREVESVELAIARSRGSGLLRGAGIGALLGAGTGAVLGAVDCRDDSFWGGPRECAVWGAIALGVVGTIPGAFVGSAFPGTRWLSVELPGGGEVSVEPVGVRVSVRF